jgi:hypothetical protein
MNQRLEADTIMSSKVRMLNRICSTGVVSSTNTITMAAMPVKTVQAWYVHNMSWDLNVAKRAKPCSEYGAEKRSGERTEKCHMPKCSYGALVVFLSTCSTCTPNVTHLQPKIPSKDIRVIYFDSCGQQRAVRDPHQYSLVRIAGNSKFGDIDAALYASLARRRCRFDLLLGVPTLLIFIVVGNVHYIDFKLQCSRV